MHTHMHACIHICPQTYMYMYIHAYIPTYIHAFIHTHIMNLYTPTYIRVCMHTYIQTSTHNHIVKNNKKQSKMTDLGQGLTAESKDRACPEQKHEQSVHRLRWDKKEA